MDNYKNPEKIPSSVCVWGGDLQGWEGGGRRKSEGWEPEVLFNIQSETNTLIVLVIENVF